MDERIVFWSRQEAWPRDTPIYVFLARAVHIVGKSMFPTEWTEGEPITPEPYRLNLAINGITSALPQSTAKPWQKDTVHRLILRHHPEFKRPPTRHGKFGPEGLTFTAEEWQAAHQTAQRLDAERLVSRRRFDVVVREIANQIADGILKYALRDARGGTISSTLCSPDLWNTESISPRFYWCQMNRENPFGVAVGGDGFQSIFIERATLDRFLASRVTSQSSKPDRGPKKAYSLEEKLLPYAQTIYEAVERGESEPPTRDEFVSKFRDKFPDVSIPIVRSLVWPTRPKTWNRRAAKGS